MQVLITGEGSLRPGPNDLVKVHYTGWTSDGSVFDDTGDGRPSILGVNKLVPGWQGAIRLMIKGQRNRLWIPAYLAYGSRPSVLRAPVNVLCIDVS